MKAFSLTVLLSLLLAANASSAQDIDERLDADPNGRVEISNVAGEITVTGWDDDVVAITGTLGRGVERLDFSRDDDLIQIEVIYPRDGRSSGGSDLHIRVPLHSSLDVSAVSAAIAVDAVNGRQRLRTVSGDVSVDAAVSDIEAETVSGDIRVKGTDTASHHALSTVSGSIETRAVSGELEAGTVSGRIDVEAGMLNRARLNTTNGRISVAGGLARDGRFDLSTTNGQVTVRLDHDADLDVDAQTFNGGIDNCFGVDSTRSRYSPEKTLRFQRGAANRTLRVRSMVGRIDLCADNVGAVSE